jgi:hypothetical protein
MLLIKHKTVLKLTNNGAYPWTDLFEKRATRHLMSEYTHHDASLIKAPDKPRPFIVYPLCH